MYVKVYVKAIRYLIVLEGALETTPQIITDNS